MARLYDGAIPIVKHSWDVAVKGFSFFKGVILRTQRCKIGISIFVERRKRSRKKITTLFPYCDRVTVLCLVLSPNIWIWSELVRNSREPSCREGLKSLKPDINIWMDGVVSRALAYKVTMSWNCFWRGSLFFLHLRDHKFFQHFLIIGVRP